MSSTLLERELKQAFEYIDFIGELAVNRSTFEQMCQIIQREMIFGKKRYVDRVPPALFVTTMVFAARYSNQQARNFWQPYGKLVWKLNETGMSFQNRCRQKFIKCIEALEEQFAFEFPQRSSGDVVRPIYRHAIIPYYLQDDFAAWLKNNWRAIIEIPPEFLMSELRTDDSLDTLPRTLRTFIKSEDTADTASAIITNMAQAASAYAEGETLESISQLLASSPIERALWDELAKVYAEQAEVITRRRSDGNIAWVWSLDDHEMQLRVANLTIDTSSQPDRVVWVGSTEEPAEAESWEILDAWRGDDGSWWIDEIILTDGPVGGKVLFLDDDKAELQRFNVPHIPDRPILLFRSTQQGLYGTMIDYTSHTLNNGLWHISTEPNITIKDTTGQLIQPIETLPVPELLSAERGHTKAGLYDLTLPVTLWQDDAPLIELVRKSVSAGTPEIIGRDNETPGLSPKVPPTFTNLNIWLKIPDVSERLMNRATLWIKSTNFTLQRQLRQLEQNGQLSFVENGTVQIYLGDLLPPQAATYTVQLRQNLQPILPTPLQFSVLPDISIQPPALYQIYSPQNLPICIISGLTPENIVASEKVLVEKQATDTIKITWLDLRDDIRLRLRLDQNVVSLAWRLKRIFAWITPGGKDNILTIDDLERATLSVIAPKDHARYFRLWIEGQAQKRTLDFNATGHYISRIKDDQLYDMIRNHQNTRSEIHLELYQTSWKIFEVRRLPQIQQAKITYHHDVEGGKLIFKCGIDQSWVGDFKFQLRYLNDFFLPPRIVLETSLLADTHTIALDLSRGTYLLEILHEGEPLILEQNAMLFTVGEDQILCKTTNIATLHDYLRGKNKGQVPPEIAEDYLRFLAQQVKNSPDPQSLLTSIRLFQLATLPTTSYQNISNDDLVTLWPPLLRLKEINNVETWEEQYGLLPAWATLQQPLWLKVKDRAFKLKIYPERASRKGQHGVGYADLQLRPEALSPNRVYAKWTPQENGIVHVIFGLPDTPPQTSYTELDELDLWPLFQCTHCGKLVGTKGGQLPTPIQKRHLHNQKEAKFVDIIYDSKLFAFPSLDKSGERLPPFFKPQQVIDHSPVIAYSLKHRLPEPRPANHPISQDAHRFALLHSLHSHRQNPEKRLLLDKLVGEPHWKQGIQRLAQELAYDIDLPLFAATGRFLKGFQEESNHQPLIQLDKYVTLLALLLRAIAYEPQEFEYLSKAIQLSEADLIEMLATANQACPELLTWGLTWIELFQVHAVA